MVAGAYTDWRGMGSPDGEADLRLRRGFPSHRRLEFKRNFI